MTDGQIKYQSLMENQRHNLEMEKIGEVEASARTVSADATKRQADVAASRAGAQNFADYGSTITKLVGGAMNALGTMAGVSQGFTNGLGSIAGAIAKLFA